MNIHKERVIIGDLHGKCNTIAVSLALSLAHPEGVQGVCLSPPPRQPFLNIDENEIIWSQ